MCVRLSTRVYVCVRVCVNVCVLFMGELRLWILAL